MLPAWTNDYIGIPYRFGGDSRDGADCWGLVRMILREVFGKDVAEVPHHNGPPFELAAIVAAALPTIGALPVAEPEVGDLALLRIAGKPCHVAVVVDRGVILHTLAPHDSVIESLDRRWKYRLEGFYCVP